MDRYSRYLSFYLLFLGLLAIPHYVDLIWFSGPLWSPVDELAHYDYIDQLSSGHMPHPRDSITPYSERITAEYFGFPEGVHYDGTNQSLGTTGKSYEAHQPPLYYLLLAGPNYLLKAAGVPPPVQIRILRSFNILIFVGTAILILLTFRDLTAMMDVDPLLGHFVAYVTVSVRFIQRYSISCDNLAAIIGAACIWLSVRLWRTGDQRYIGWSCLAAVLTFLTKYTNGLLFLVWGLNTLYFCQHRGRNPLRSVLWQWSPLALPVLYILGNGFVYGWDDPLKSKSAAEYFAGFLGINLNVFEIIRDLMGHSMDLRPALEYRTGVAIFALGLISLNYAISFYRLLILQHRRILPIFVACQMSVLIILAAFLLNPYVGGVSWYFYRHYEGYDGFWYTSLVALPFLFENQWFRSIGIGIGAVAATWITYVWL